MAEPPSSGSVQLMEMLEVDYATVAKDEGAAGNDGVVTE